MKLRYKILGATAAIILILFLIKAIALIIPVLGTGITAFIVLGLKAYIGNKLGAKIEENEDRILAKGKSTILNTPEEDQR